MNIKRPSHLTNIAGKYNMNCLFYVDDSQLHVIFKTLSHVELIEREAALLDCAGEMDMWMVGNKLKRNRDKQSLLSFLPSFDLDHL